MIELEEKHKGLLRKFEALQGQTLRGKKSIKGFGGGQQLPPDELVPEQHILHDLVRGFYKPAKKNYILSYLATESMDNYGEQIVWTNKEAGEFQIIRMKPPAKPGDNRAPGDIAAARFCMENEIPIGLIQWIDTGVYRILGLGRIEKEQEDGVFVVRPYRVESFLPPLETIRLIDQDRAITETERDALIKTRVGQSEFRSRLLKRHQRCALCGLADERLLIASHIKPWRVSEPVERLDEANGLLLCVMHDALFDKGLISFKPDGKILISESLSESAWPQLNLNPEMNFEVPVATQTYLEWHRTRYFGESSGD